MLRASARQNAVLELPYSNDKIRRKASRDTKHAGYVALGAAFLLVCGIWALTDHALNGHPSHAPMTMHRELDDWSATHTFNKENSHGHHGDLHDDLLHGEHTYAHHDTNSPHQYEGSHGNHNEGIEAHPYSGHHASEDHHHYDGKWLT